jgi:excisionase family DNA binding protein
MTALAVFEPAVLTDRQAEQARTAARAMARAFDLAVHDRRATVDMAVEVKSGSPSRSTSQRVPVPLPALRLFVQLLSELASGNPVTLVPLHYELTTQEAADLLNVSRPYLIRLLEEGRIPFRKVGTRRRVLFKDLMTFKEREAVHRRQVLDELTTEAEDLDLGY